jgi:hypothetical protein
MAQIHGVLVGERVYKEGKAFCPVLISYSLPILPCELFGTGLGSYIADLYSGRIGFCSIIAQALVPAP